MSKSVKDYVRPTHLAGETKDLNSHFKYLMPLSNNYFVFEMMPPQNTNSCNLRFFHSKVVG